MRGLAWLAVTLAACGGNDEITGPGAPDVVDWDDVAPILQDRCTSCHQPDSVGPMSLATYEEAAPWADAIAADTAARIMPPWLVVDDGTCGTYQDSQWLTDEEIATLAAWAEGGAKPGGQAPITPEQPPTLGDRRDLALVTPEIVPISEGDIFAPNDEYRCVTFPNDQGRDWFLTGYEVEPGNDLIVHHVLAMVVDPDAPGWGSLTNAEEIAQMDAADPTREGWDCLGTVGGNGRERAIPGTWAPGQGAVTFPEGLGVRVRATDWIVVQIHYSLAAPGAEGQSDSTTLYLRTEDEVEREAFVALPDPFIESVFTGSFDYLDPGDTNVKYEWELTGEDILWRAYVDDASAVDSFELWSVMPHMHQRGRQQSLHLKHADGGRDCAMDVPRWDFGWQRIYLYETPIRARSDDVFQVKCNYDTSDTSAPIFPGWGTENEMCLVVMMLTVD